MRGKDIFKVVILIEVAFVFYFIISQNLNALRVASITFVISWSRRVFQGKTQKHFQALKNTLIGKYASGLRWCSRLCAQLYPVCVQLCLKRSMPVCLTFIYICIYMHVFRYNMYICKHFKKQYIHNDGQLLFNVKFSVNIFISVFTFI